METWKNKKKFQIFAEASASVGVLLDTTLSYNT